MKNYGFGMFSLRIQIKQSHFLALAIDSNHRIEDFPIYSIGAKFDFDTHCKHKIFLKLAIILAWFYHISTLNLIGQIDRIKRMLLASANFFFHHRKECITR